MGFADEMEGFIRSKVAQHVDASAVEDLFGSEVPKFKPWYSPKWMYEPVEGGVNRVFLGIHPGSNPSFRAGQTCDKPGCDHEQLAYVNDLQSCCPYNDWLDSGCWGKNGEAHQTKARRVFKSLYGDSVGITKFRFARCSNVCPFRSTKTSDIPQTVWDASKKWCEKLLNRLQPKTIICNGYEDTGRSPWSTINGLYRPQLEQSVRSGNAEVKIATMSFDGTVETTIIGLPHLSSSYFRKDHYDALRIVADLHHIA